MDLTPAQVWGAGPPGCSGSAEAPHPAPRVRGEASAHVGGGFIQGESAASVLFSPVRVPGCHPWSPKKGVGFTLRACGLRRKGRLSAPRPAPPGCPPCPASGAWAEISHAPISETGACAWEDPGRGDKGRACPGKPGPSGSAAGVAGLCASGRQSCSLAGSPAWFAAPCPRTDS